MFLDLALINRPSRIPVWENLDQGRKYRSSRYSLELAGLLSSKCRVRSRKIINMHNGRVSVELDRGKSLLFKLSR